MGILKLLFVAFVIAVISLAPAAGAEWSTQKNSQSAVTVAITPVNLSAGVKTWDFKVVLDTHSQALDDDLLKAAALIDDRGGRHAPVAWDGAAPGGHHREGVLRFKPIAPRPPSIELQLRRPNEPAARTFRWALR